MDNEPSVNESSVPDVLRRAGDQLVDTSFLISTRRSSNEPLSSLNPTWLNYTRSK